jgi:hypothetical protein
MQPRTRGDGSVENEPRDGPHGPEFGLQTAHAEMELFGVSTPEAHEIVMFAGGM